METLKIKKVFIVLPLHFMEIKDRILTGARELFFRHGIKSITMDDIARHLGISKKTIYQSFTDKDQLVNELTDMMLLQNLSDFDCITNQNHDPLLEMLEMMKHMGKMFSQINPNLFHDMMKFHGSAFLKFKKFKEEQMYRKIEENLKKGKDSGLYRTDIQVKILAKLRLEQIEMAWRMDLFPPDKFNHTMVQMHLLDHFIHGICTLKGHKLLNKYKQLKEEE